MSGKQRLSASVDTELMRTAQQAVAEGQVESVSAWVNDALRLKADHDRRLAALDAFLSAYEAAHGEITEQEIGEAVHRTRGRAVVVRGNPQAGKPSSGGRGRGVA